MRYGDRVWIWLCASPEESVLIGALRKWIDEKPLKAGEPLSIGERGAGKARNDFEV